MGLCWLFKLEPVTTAKLHVVPANVEELKDQSVLFKAALDPQVETVSLK